MAILQTGTRSSGHESIRSEERAAPPPRVETGRARPVSRVEAVPGYQRRIPRPTSETMGSALAALATQTPVVRPPVSAARASFGTTDHAEVVIGDDDRTVVPDPTQLPWRHICALRITSATGKEYVGTGWFIGSRTLMTAGHCVYLHDEGGWPASIKVIPALNGNAEPYGEVVGTRFRATGGWIEDRNTNFDYGVIQLDDGSLGPTAGWFAFATYEDSALLSNDANISGYPYDLDHATRQYFHARRVATVSPFKLFYDIDTFGGQSGSPIWFEVGGERVAIGVHTTGSSTSNSGTRITPEVFQNMQAWSSEPLKPEMSLQYTPPASR